MRWTSPACQTTWHRTPNLWVLVLHYLSYYLSCSVKGVTLYRPQSVQSLEVKHGYLKVLKNRIKLRFTYHCYLMSYEIFNSYYSQQIIGLVYYGWIIWGYDIPYIFLMYLFILTAVWIFPNNHVMCALPVTPSCLMNRYYRM